MYEITILNPEHVCRGVREMTVDGARMNGNVLPSFGDGKTHQVEVVLG